MRGFALFNSGFAAGGSSERASCDVGSGHLARALWNDESARSYSILQAWGLTERRGVGSAAICAHHYMVNGARIMQARQPTTRQRMMAHACIMHRCYRIYI